MEGSRRATHGSRRSRSIVVGAGASCVAALDPSFVEVRADRTSPRLRFLGALLIAGGAMALGCTAQTGDVRAYQATPVGAESAPDTHADVVASTMDDSASAWTASSFGAASIVFEADTGCVATTTAPKIELDSPPHSLLTELRSVGPNRLARDLAGDGFVLFGSSGDRQAPSVIDLGFETHAALSATGISVAGFSEASRVLFQTFDATAKPVGGPRDFGLGDSDQPIAVARSTSETAIVWATADDGLALRIVGASDAVSNEVRLESSAPSRDLSLAIVPSYAGDGSKFLVLWSLYRTSLAGYDVHAALVDDAGIVGQSQLVLRSDVPVRIVEAIAASSGSTLLLNRDGEPMVVPLDVRGRVTGASHVYLGARDVIVGGGHGIARTGDELAIVAHHTSGAAVLRRLDLGGQPKDGWICLDTPRPDDFHLSGIAADAAGYSTIIAAGSGKTALLRLDTTGRHAQP